MVNGGNVTRPGRDRIAQRDKMIGKLAKGFGKIDSGSGRENRHSVVDFARSAAANVTLSSAEVAWGRGSGHSRVDRRCPGAHRDDAPADTSCPGLESGSAVVDTSCPGVESGSGVVERRVPGAVRAYPRADTSCPDVESASAPAERRCPATRTASAPADSRVPRPQTASAHAESAWTPCPRRDPPRGGRLLHTRAPPPRLKP